MKVVVFGGSGQLGQEILPRARDLNFDVVYPTLHELDIADENQVLGFLKKIKPNHVINCAAYTAVDKAEEEIELARSINTLGAHYIAKAAHEVQARMIHISTDYVFAGHGTTPLSENAPTEPTSVYGKSKLEGEQLVLEATQGKAAIVRTSSLHGQHGQNFVHTMLSLFEQKKNVSVVADQTMSPCWAGYLAESLIDLLRIDFSGVLHAACSDSATWYDFAKKIGELSFSAANQPTITATTMADFQRPAPRPQYSVFDLTKFEKVLGRKPITWQEGLKYHLSEIKQLQQQR